MYIGTYIIYLNINLDINILSLCFDGVWNEKYFERPGLIPKEKTGRTIPNKASNHE